jgi:phage gp36-like protein
MAYAAVQDLIDRYGEAELIRLTTPEGQDMGGVDRARVNAALADASALIDSYVRRRYATPVVPTPPELLRACCIMARFELAHGDAREPSAQMKEARKDVLDWLGKLRDGVVFLDTATPVSPESQAQMQARGRQDGGRPVLPDNCDAGAAPIWPLPPFWSTP